jgi:sulfate permease, SulP family
MDATGLNALEDLYERLRRRGKHLLLSAPHTQPLFMMDKAGFLDRLGRENVCANIDLALARARELLGLPAEVATDPLEVEKRRMDEARKELSAALEKAQRTLNGSVTGPPSVGK